MARGVGIINGKSKVFMHLAYFEAHNNRMTGKPYICTLIVYVHFNSRCSTARVLMHLLYLHCRGTGLVAGRERLICDIGASTGIDKEYKLIHDLATAFDL
jgi:hypothetical protein